MDLQEATTLITGVTGFAGFHLANFLLQQGARNLHGLTRKLSPVIIPEVSLHQTDFKDLSNLTALLARIKPQFIYHLAGFSQTGKSFENETASWEGNFHATQNLIQAVLKTELRPRILFTGSGLIYGQSNWQDEFKTELSELSPESPYACSKAAADLYCYQCYKNHGLEIIRARPFNHIGPGQSSDFAVPNFCRQIALIENRKLPPLLETGNLDSARDFTDVRDMVRGYSLLMRHGSAGETYNLASGKNQIIRKVLENLVSLSKNQNIKINETQDKNRPTEKFPIQVDIQKFQKCTNWNTEIPFQKTLADTLEYWRLKTI